MGETWQLFNLALKLNRCQLNWFLHIEIVFIERKLWSLLFPILKFAVIQLASWVRFNYVLKVCNRVQWMEAVKWREKTLLTWLNLTWQTFWWMEKPFSNIMGGPLLKSAGWPDYSFRFLFRQNEAVSQLPWTELSHFVWCPLLSGGDRK